MWSELSELLAQQRVILVYYYYQICQSYKRFYQILSSRYVHKTPQSEKKTETVFFLIVVGTFRATCTSTAYHFYLLSLVLVLPIAFQASFTNRQVMVTALSLLAAHGSRSLPPTCIEWLKGAMVIMGGRRFEWPEQINQLHYG